MPQPIIIAGAGITGLVLAQALTKHSIPFIILERDPDPLFRGKGWGVTIHWALDALLGLLPQHVIDRLPEAYVDNEATENGDNGNFLFFNLRTAEALWQVPPAKRIRMSREKFRRVLMDGIDIKWNHDFESFQPKGDGVEATFTSPSGTTTIQGRMLIGCDGSRSLVRKSLFPREDQHANYKLPVRLLGASTIYDAKLSSTVRVLDPFFFQGGDPRTNAAHWFSFLDSPSSSGRGDDTRECQILVSWPFRPGFDGCSEPLEVPAKGVERVRLMKHISREWADPFRTIVQSIPEDTDVKTITLEDWVPPTKGWTTVPGSDRVVLVGDAAHAMTMYRGEAANHGLADVDLLVSQLLSLSEMGSPAAALKTYTSGMVERAATAVLKSRQACLDAHSYERINDDSPLIQKRAIRTQPVIQEPVSVA